MSSERTFAGCWSVMNPPRFAEVISCCVAEVISRGNPVLASRGNVVRAKEQRERACGVTLGGSGERCGDSGGAPREALR